MEINRRSFLIGSGLATLSSLMTPNSSFALSGNQRQDDIMGVISKYLSTRSSLSKEQRLSAKQLVSSPNKSDLIQDLLRRDSIFDNLHQPNSWNGNFHNAKSKPQLVFLDDFGSTVVVGVKDQLSLDWTPNKVDLNAEEKFQALSQVNSPEKLGLNSPTSIVNSLLTSDHTITLGHTSKGWVVLDDQYSEIGIGGITSNFYKDDRFDYPTIDLSAANITAQNTLPTNIGANLLGRTFDYMSAVNYSNSWATSYNSAYSNFSPNDCANFVSQCFTAGGYPVDANWFKYSGPWINNLQLRNWLISSGRGLSAPAQSSLGYADIVNFKSASTLQWAHVAIVTRPYSLGSLISCHSNAQKNVSLAAYGSDASWAGMQYASTYLNY